MSTKSWFAVLGLAAALALAGCFDVEQSLVLKKDLSGTASLRMMVNLESMAVMAARMQHQMSGQEGEPTAAEIEQAKKEMLASMQKEGSPAPPAAEIEKGLPPGVKLLDSGVADEGLKLRAHFTFGFDDVANLQQIRMPEKADAEKKPGGKNPFETPFGDLQITRQGDTLLLTTKPTNPAAEQTDKMGGDVPPEMKKQMEEAFKDLRVVWNIQAPFQVLETNATRREGDTLYWEYDLKTFETMTPQQRAEGVRVKYRR